MNLFKLNQKVLGRIARFYGLLLFLLFWDLFCFFRRIEALRFAFFLMLALCRSLVLDTSRSTLKKSWLLPLSNTLIFHSSLSECLLAIRAHEVWRILFTTVFQFLDSFLVRLDIKECLSMTLLLRELIIHHLHFLVVDGSIHVAALF